MGVEDASMQQIVTPHAVQDLETALVSERAERRWLQREFDVRDAALDAAPSKLMIIDVARHPWKIVYLNRAVCRQYGYQAAELLGRSPLRLICLSESKVALGRILAAVQQGAQISVELVARRRDHTTFSLGMSMTPVPGAVGDRRFYVCVGADITARLAQERAQRELQEQLMMEMQKREHMAIELRLAQKLESVGRLAAGIAHEINTPVQYIGDSVAFLRSATADLARLRAEYQRAIARLVRGDPQAAVLAETTAAETAIDVEFLTSEIPKAFERTLQGVERVAAIVRAMKEFAHPDSAQHAYADLNDAILTTLTVAHNEYKYYGRIETRFGEVPLVSCNVGELNQVFLNLIVNAAHALADSGKDVSQGVITVSTALEGDEVAISIADNGCGIPPENQEKIFDLFFTTKAVGRGTGQGLAIARAIIVEKHGGRIDLQSSVGRGSTFTLHLPVKGRASSQDATQGQ
jgi:PAS domain S-box-containing protein